MSGFPILTAPTPRLSVPSRQYYRTVSGSPTRQHFQQHVDDLITQLTPSNAVSALRFPTGPLKACLETATASEQSFVMRAALAASSIQEWLDELSEWRWPEGGGPAGFEEPVYGRGKRMFGRSTTPASSSPVGRTLFSPTSPVTPERPVFGATDYSGGSRKGGGEPSWMGSLRANEVALYDERIAEIGREIDDLEIEDMKQHVLHHHILPLSPPGTPPIGGRLRSSSTASASFARMDDLTAVVTAIVLQALPLLSKLVRLLDVWRIRLLVLKKIPAFLDSLTAAEVAIHSAWKAVRPSSLDGGSNRTAMGAEDPILRREEFAIMKSVVESKVSKAARTTDFMLDALDGWEDTIPEEWIDRIDAAERDYGEWVALCERKIRESDWRRVTVNRPALAPPVQLRETIVPLPAGAVTAVTPAAAATAMTIKLVKKAIHTTNQRPADDRPTTPDDTVMPTKALFPTLPRTPPRALSAQSSLESLRSEPELPSFTIAKSYADDDEDMGSPSASVIHVPSDERLPSDLGLASEDPASLSFADELPDDTTDLGDESTIPEPEDPEELRMEASPSSSPPDFRASSRSTVTFKDMPTVTEIPGEESPTVPKTPVESSFVFDGATSDDMDISQDMPSYLDSPGSPASPASINCRRMSVTSEDDQLQQQISEILESIPAKIHLSSQPSPSFSHLNPPDFKMPRKPKAPADGTRSLSSMSNMSSRSMTPSFLLAPAYARKPRQQRGNQEIKLYHLSRSTGEAPIKLFIRLVGENGERVMVRVGGGWADLTEYLKEYASHHSRRSKSGGESKIEIRDLPLSSSIATSLNSRVGSSPPSRPNSALDSPNGMGSLNIRKTRRATGASIGTAAGDDSSVLLGASNDDVANRNPRTPLASVSKPKPSNETPSSEASTRSRSSSRLSWTEEDSSLGMSGPRAKNIEMSEESKAWVESVKERVRIASGERRVSDQLEGKFGEIGKVGGTKRLFRKGVAGKSIGDRP
ncbi:hypothetical protein SCUCBS95973_005325 [Sporothrix curviconia]|uniref:GAR domain-containing protein n=1 Tax=Sporothrix curviconia TaxID=1260050 RepID=A0ABP0BWA4_9PEZI